jgi:hypothetical protein
MKSSFFLLLICLNLSTIHSQSTVFQVWNELGVSGKFTKDFSFGADLTTRYGNDGLGTIFPQLSFKYKINKFVRLSVDYRLIGKKELDGNYLTSERLNGNLQFSYALNRHSFGFRTRYQYSFNKISGPYESEFDQAFRFKPSYSYDINNSILTPNFSCEFFYNPVIGENGKQFTRIRYYAGVEMELDGPHSLELGYYYDQKIQVANPVNRSIMNLSYSYSIGQSKKKESTKTKRGARFL